MQRFAAQNPVGQKKRRFILEGSNVFLSGSICGRLCH